MTSRIWSEHIWEAGTDRYLEILRHPFITELADGSLRPERFARYLAQDELYLPVYCRLMHRVAEMLPDAGDRKFMHDFADAGGESEKEMHDRLAARFHVDTQVAPSGITLAYCDHLEAAADSGSAAVAVAAMLPCSWVYNRVGLHILGIAHLEGNPYREWIEEYGNEEYRQTVGKMVAVADSLASSTDADTVSRMDRAFLEALRFEYDFWEYGYSGKAGQA